MGVLDGLPLWFIGLLFQEPKTTKRTKGHRGIELLQAVPLRLKQSRQWEKRHREKSGFACFFHKVDLSGVWASG